MLYFFGSRCIDFALGQFFREIRCVGAPICESGPLLVVANHPNFMLDSLVVNSIFQRELWFLAKATLFHGPLAKVVLEKAHLVPVHRRQDSVGDMSRNEETFAFATGRLMQGGGIVIFPEGVSLGERKISPIKTGAARIVLQTEAASNFKLGLQIQAIGLTYTDLQSFRSAITVTVSEPIRVSDFEKRYHENAVETVRELTAELEQALKRVTVEVQEVEHGQLLEKIGKLYEPRTNLVDHRERYQRIARNLELLGPRLSDLRRELEGWIDLFFELSALFALEGTNARAPGAWSRVRIASVARAVVVLVGVLAHFVPYKAIEFLVPRFSTHPVSIASCKFALGLVLVPLWYMILVALLILSGVGWVGSIFAALALAMSGVMANRYWPETRLLALSCLWPGKRKPHQIVESMREILIARLEQLRVE